MEFDASDDLMTPFICNIITLIRDIGGEVWNNLWARHDETGHESEGIQMRAPNAIKDKV